MIDLTLEQILGRTVYHYQLLLPIIWRKRKKKIIFSQTTRVVGRKLENMYAQRQKKSVSTALLMMQSNCVISESLKKIRGSRRGSSTFSVSDCKKNDDA